MSKILNLQNQVQVTVLSQNVKQICTNLELLKLKYSMGEKVSIYSLGLSGQQIYIQATDLVDKESIENLAFHGVMPLVAETQAL